MGGTWKPYAAQIKTNKEMMGLLYLLSGLEGQGGPEWETEKGGHGEEGEKEERRAGGKGLGRVWEGGQVGFLFDL